MKAAPVRPQASQDRGRRGSRTQDRRTMEKPSIRRDNKLIKSYSQCGIVDAEDRYYLHRQSRLCVYAIVEEVKAGEMEEAAPEARMSKGSCLETMGCCHRL